MPGPHFNSKRLQNARNVRAEFAPGLVPRVGTSLFTLRLLPRTVEKNCGCHVRQPMTPAAAPAAPAAPAGPTPAAAAVRNNNELIDPLDPNGNSTTHTSFIQTRNIQAGDYLYFTKPGTTTIHLTSVDEIFKNNGRAYKMTLSHSHDIATLTNVQVYFPKLKGFNKAELRNNNQIKDIDNLNNNGTDTIFETYKVKVNDLAAFQDSNTGKWIAATVTILEKNANGKILSIRVTPNHGKMAASQFESILLSDNR